MTMIACNAKIKGAIVVFVGVICLGYVSNSVLITAVSYRAGEHRNVQSEETLAKVAEHKTNDSRHDYVQSDYWPGPRMDISYSARIPFVITAHYYFVGPFDHGQLGGSGYKETTIGVFIPLKRWQHGNYIH